MKLQPKIAPKLKTKRRMRMRMVFVAASFAIFAVASTLTLIYTFSDIGTAKAVVTVTAVATGNWGDDSTWDTGLKPTSVDDVVIPSGYTVTANSDWTCATLTINGPTINGTTELTISDGKTITVTGNVNMNMGADRKKIAKLTMLGSSILDVDGNVTLTCSDAKGLLVDMSDGASNLKLAGSLTVNTEAVWESGSLSTLTLDGSAAQTIPSSSGLGFNHVILNNSSSAGVLIDADITSAIIAGDLRVQSGTLNNGGYAINGNAMGSATFEVASGAKFKLTGSSTFATFGNYDINSNSTVIYDGNGPQTIGAVNYGNLTSSNVGDRTLPDGATVGISGTFTPGFNSFTITGSTIDYNGTGSQTIKAFNYNNLTSSSTGTRALPTSGKVRVAGTFTPGSNAWTVTSSTFEYNGTGTGMNAQTIIAFDYNNLTSSSSGERTLASSGTIGISGAFTPGTNSYTNTGSTIEFKGSGAQTIPAINYNNLTSSGSGTRTLASSGTIGIAATFTSGGNTYTTTGSTVDFNGTTTQTIPNFSFNNLTASNISGVNLSGDLTVPGDMIISGSLNGGGGVITVNGNWTNNGTYTHGSKDVTLSGSSAQVIGGSASTTFNNLKIDNTNGVTLNKAVEVEGVLTLTNGKITTTSTNLLTFDVSATVTGGSSSNYINGPAAKNTNSTSAFTFPSGKNSTYMPLGIEPNNTTATTFTAEFFDDSSSTAKPTSPKGAGLNRVSTLEYFQLDRDLGGGPKADAKVTLYWDSNSRVDGSYLADLRVAHWDGLQWEDMGNSSYSGDATSGSVTSSTYITSFSPFSLGSSSENNPLPIELITFNAKQVGNHVELNWSTATEINNDFFTIERSIDGQNVEVIGEVFGVGNSNTQQDYTFTDENPLVGTSYYRLKQTDYDGQFEYFDWVVVNADNSNKFTITQIGPNPCRGNLKINYNSPNEQMLNLTILSLTGQKIYNNNFEATAGENEITVAEIATVQNGLYIINLSNGIYSTSDKLFKSD
ncbi:MAG: T9SS type A sorting domain-containing protein [Bacteroidia bacterium]|nr:T9SS type A sorting domain-containing protein [Bacteroidia bacterium]